MAEIVLCPLLQVIFDKVASGLLKSIALKFGYEEEIDKLRHTINLIRAVVEDAEERQVREKALKIWLADLKEVAYDVDNLLDEFCLDAITARGRTQGFYYQKVVRDFLPSFKPVAVYLELFPKLREIRKRLDVLAAERSLKEGVVKIGSDFESRRQTGSFVIESEVVGREEDKEAVIDLLASNGASGFGRKISVIPIVGLGGVGKTTLAQLAYNDERVKKSFELKIWVCVNEDFNVRKIMKLIIESVTLCKCDFLGMDVLQSQLRRLLRGRRYLLVLDDVWNEDHEEWDKLRVSLSDGAEGSHVIVTTRSAKVATIVGTIPPYYLKALSHDDCWTLFKQRAFAPGEEYSNFLPVGKEIVKKCGGIPLAAKALGSLMRFKREESDWLYVQESDLWNACEGEDRILPALRLSYSHLPSHLKCCFTFCSVFPKNFVIKKDNLTHLWIAEGLIRSNNERKTLEDIANDYFNDLMWMFFFQDVNKDSDGNVLDCKMHDLIHNLAQSVVGGEFVVLEHGHIPRHLAQTRHSSVVCDSDLQTIPESLYEAKKLRTLNLVFSKGDLGEAPPKLFSSFRYLRTLNLSGSGIKKLHSSISCLISLRYLNVSNTLIEILPESICDLGYLQVLNLSDCHDLIELPRRLASIFQLRHLMIYGCCRLSQFPDHIGRLIQLQTLPVFIVGTEISQGLRQLRLLPLAGELNIRKLENVKPGSDAASASLRRKPKLHSLGLSWRNNHDALKKETDDRNRQAEVLDSLQPHQNLKRLSVEGYSGDRFPTWIGFSGLPNLTNIVLINCKRCENLPALGQLPFLRVIYMHGMHSVKSIDSGFYGRGSGRPFQSLQELSLVDFPNLEFWWSLNTKEEFPSLVKLFINKCERLKNMPWFPSLQHLEFRNCNEMIMKSATNFSTLLTLLIDGFTGQLVIFERLLENNPCLTSLTISSCPNLRSISSKLGCLVALKSLTIRWCQELIALPQEIQNLSLLESLEISECHSLTVLPEGIEGLTSLRSLSIENCENLAYIARGLGHLIALEHLTIMYCPSLAFLPENFRNLTMLKSLCILSCPRLASLPEELQHVTTLQSLEIHSCPAFKDLPEWIGNLSSLTSLTISDCHTIISLPANLQHLTTLQHLSIRECPRLESRCKKYVGEDWPKVAHIPHTYIGSQPNPDKTNASSSLC